jgi:peptide/nickel transport system substrate-binding protein
VYNKLDTVFISMMIVCIGLASCGGAKATTVAPFYTSQPVIPSATVVPSATPKSATPSATNPQPAINPTNTPSTGAILTISLDWQDPWVRNFNPFYFPSITYPRYCIYEPLMAFNSRTGELIPWLATGYSWGVNSQTLTFNLRRGVLWSDGTQFGAEDVVATFNMLKNHADITGSKDYPNPLSVWLEANITDISAPDAFTVVFQFNNVYTPGLYKLATQFIVPAHIWGDLDKPQDFENQNPVGTGPFTQVTIFEDKQAGFERILQLERNPYYWQKDKLSFDGVKISYRHDENILDDLAKGKSDWASIAIPDIQKDFLNNDPTHYQVLVDTSSSITLLQLNTARPPFDNKDVRKAISMSIDRKKIVDTISQGYLDPANIVGLGNMYKSWWNEYAIGAGTWIGENPAQANTLLDSLGFKKGVDGTRVAPDGKPMVFKLMTDPGYPEQDAAARVIVLSLANIGVVVSVSPDDNFWDDFSSDKYDMALFADGYGFGKTPYEFYFGLMSPSGTPLPGAKTNQIAGRYTSPEAGSLLDQFIKESDPLRQKTIMNKVQTIFVEDAPSIPLYSNFWFIEFNTLRFTGFPSVDDPYAEGSPGDILVLLNLRPR